MVLKELRQLMETSQVDLAQAMQKNQAVISRLEGSDDMLLSSLVKYIQAMGGELELRAKFEDWEARIDPAPVQKSGTRG
jgi:predicted transcriptional regulator